MFYHFKGRFTPKKIHISLFCILQSRLLFKYILIWSKHFKWSAIYSRQTSLRLKSPQLSSKQSRLINSTTNKRGNMFWVKLWITNLSPSNTDDKLLLNNIYQICLLAFCYLHLFFFSKKKKKSGAVLSHVFPSIDGEFCVLPSFIFSSIPLSSRKQF